MKSADDTYSTGDESTSFALLSWSELEWALCWLVRKAEEKRYLTRWDWDCQNLCRHTMCGNDAGIRPAHNRGWQTDGQIHLRVHATENVIGKHELDMPLNVSLRGDCVAGPD